MDNNDFIFSADHALVYEFINDLRSIITIEELMENI